jgi:chemotaxis protein methyltransferase CheR
MRRYLDMNSPAPGQMRVNDVLRPLIAFKPLNLLAPWPMKGKFDIIFCRNVVIYFDQETQAKLFNRFADIIADDGYLYIGHSESLFHVCDRFKAIGKTIHRKVK